MAKKRRRLKKSVKFGLIIFLSIVLMFLVFVMLQSKPLTNDKNDVPSDDNVQIDDLDSSGISIYEGLKITDTANYAGIYMEDGSDEVVSNVMMIIVENTSASDLQYAEITLS